MNYCFLSSGLIQYPMYSWSLPRWYLVPSQKHQILVDSEALVEALYSTSLLIPTIISHHPTATFPIVCFVCLRIKTLSSLVAHISYHFSWLSYNAAINWFDSKQWRFIIENIWVYQCCFCHCISRNKCRLSWQALMCIEAPSYIVYCNQHFKSNVPCVC